MTFVLYDRFFSLDENNGNLKTCWRVLGNKLNSVVQLNENHQIPTLNCFNKNVISLYIFTKPSETIEFERRQLLDLHNAYGTKIKIFKFSSQIPITPSNASLYYNLDNIQTIFMIHTRLKTQFGYIQKKEVCSKRFVFKICFHNDQIRNEILKKFQMFTLTNFPDVETFVPFDDECELFLNIIFPTNKSRDNTKYTYMSIINSHYFNYVPIIETLYGVTQIINCRNIYQKVMNVICREQIKNNRNLVDIFMDNVPIVEIYIGRVYETPQCMEFNSYENELTFIMIKIIVMKRTNFIVFINSKYQAFNSTIYKNMNIIICQDEIHLLLGFFNLYTSGLMFNIFNMNAHFILANQTYKSNSFILLYRIIYNNLWSTFSKYCIISEDGKCIRFNQNSIILFDDINSSDEIRTNADVIELQNAIYLPELYNDSTLPIESSLQNLLINIKPTKKSKYEHLLNMQMHELKTLSTLDIVHQLIQNNTHHIDKYSTILEAIIELSNKVRIPIHLIYSMSTAQIAYRLLFYSFLKNGTFPILEPNLKTQAFYRSYEPKATKKCIERLNIPKDLKIYKNIQLSQNTEEGGIFQSLIKKHIPIHMTGNLIDNYFSFFRPGSNYFPYISLLVDNENELLSHKNAILWSRNELYHDVSIASFDFSLFHSTIMSLFGIDFTNCAILYGYELKSFFYNIYPTKEIFFKYNFKVLHLPHLFIMDNDTLKIHNINKFENISNLYDNNCYIVIMRFITSHIIKTIAPNYEPISGLFYQNIATLNKLKNRLPLHKNILNSMCGMLSAYNINTTILNIIYALSRKIIHYIVNNCLCDDGVVKESFLEHEYRINSLPPKYLISIESDSFTYIYNYKRLDYRRMQQHQTEVDNISRNIVSKLCTQLELCTEMKREDIEKIVNLKINFITNDLYYVKNNLYYHIKFDRTHQLVCNQKNNKMICSALNYLNTDTLTIIKHLRKCHCIKMVHLKRVHKYPEARYLLLWYLFQLNNSLTHDDNAIGGSISDQQQVIYNQLKILSTSVERDMEKNDISNYMNILFSISKRVNVDSFILKILSNSTLNIYFKNCTLPQRNLYEIVKVPSDKKTLIFNLVDLFFKLYIKNF